MVKRRAKASREGNNKPFSGAAVDAAHNQLCLKAVTSSVPSPLSNHMLDLIAGYINNIASAATQAVANGGPLVELSACLSVLVDTVAAQEKEIKSLIQHVNARKKKGILNSSSGTTAGGGMTGNVCPHCAAVRCSAPQK